MNDLENVIEVNVLKKYFPVKKGFFKRNIGFNKAVDGITFSIKEGETLGLVGESGSGKTSVGRCILRILNSSEGQIYFRSVKNKSNADNNRFLDLTKISKKKLKSLRQEIQVIFQDPYSSLNPRMTVKRIIGEPLKIFSNARASERKEKIISLLNSVGLKKEHINRYPHEFSGGQRQRICIARALALEPRLIIADEPVSALDVSIQAQVLNLLLDLQQKFKLTFLFISHDLSVVKHVSNKIAVMYLGKIVELADTRELFTNPKHPYTAALISAIPVADPDKKIARIILEGDIPNPANPPKGCCFHTRCEFSTDICKEIPPVNTEINKYHFVACHHYHELSFFK